MSHHDYRQKQLDAVKTVEDILEALDDEHYVPRVNVSRQFGGVIEIDLHVPDDAHAAGVARHLLGPDYEHSDLGLSVYRWEKLESSHGTFEVTIISEQPKAKKIAALEAEIAELKKIDSLEAKLSELKETP